MKRRRGPGRSSARPSVGARATDRDGTELPTGRIPADAARDEATLQELAWLATPAGSSGVVFVAFVAVVLWVRAIVVDLLAWIARGLMRHGRSGRQV